MYQRFGPDLAVASVASELARHVEAPNQVGSFFFWNRTRREIALSPYAMVNGVRRVYAPYLDHRVFDLLGDCPSCGLAAGPHVSRRGHCPGLPGFCRSAVRARGKQSVDTSRPARVSAVCGRKQRYAGSPAGRTLIQIRVMSCPVSLRAALDGDYFRRLGWMAPFRVLHLLQIERCCNRPIV